MNSKIINKSSAPNGCRNVLSQDGFTIIELMIGMTLGLLVLAGLVTVFVQSSQTRSEIEKNNRQIESGRYAMSVLTADLRMAGYLGSFDPNQMIIKPNSPPLSGGTAMASMPDPCSTTLSASGNNNTLLNSFFVHVQGIDNLASIPSCVTDAKTGSDILVIRRVSSCVNGPTTDANCDAPVAGLPYFQASNCYAAGELATSTTTSTDYLSFFALGTNFNAATMNKHELNCTTQAEFRRYLVRIYFVANNNQAGDGVPTLKRAELTANAFGVLQFTIVPVAEGIETLQLEYGVSSYGDGLIDGYTTDPGNSFPWCSRTGNRATAVCAPCSGTTCVANWLSTMAVKVNLLARNTTTTLGHVDTKSYQLGVMADGSNNVFGPFNDAYKRHVYNSTVRLDNPSGRLKP